MCEFMLALEERTQINYHLHSHCNNSKEVGILLYRMT